jgi:hypothetical protein
MPNLLAEIELNDKQIKAFNEELNKWKEKTKAQLSEETRSEVQTEYDVKLRQIEEEKANFKKEQIALVEEIKSKMQKVMVKRFTSVLKEMYDELKVEARKDVLNDPRILALEEIKNVLFPLMDETVTKGYVDELQKSLKMLEDREDENDKLRARLKLKEITSNLSPVVAEAVEAFIGDASTEEEVVEKYSKLKNLVKEAGDDEEAEEEPEEEESDEDEDGKKKKKKKKGKKDDEEKSDEEEPEEDEMGEAKKDKDKDDEDEDEDEEEDEKSDDDDDEEEDEEEKEDDEEVEETLEINPKVHFERKEKEVNEFMGQLNELLNLSGIPTKRE